MISVLVVIGIGLVVLAFVATAVCVAACMLSSQISQGLGE